MTDGRILAEVSDDVADAANWYDREGYVGLGERFERTFYSYVEHLQESGEIYRTVVLLRQGCVTRFGWRR